MGMRIETRLPPGWLEFLEISAPTSDGRQSALGGVVTFRSDWQPDAGQQQMCWLLAIPLPVAVDQVEIKDDLIAGERSAVAFREYPQELLANWLAVLRMILAGLRKSYELSSKRDGVQEQTQSDRAEVRP